MYGPFLCFHKFTNKGCKLLECVVVRVEPRSAQMLKQPVLSCDIVMFGVCVPAHSEYECSVGGESNV
jgi:hypothetical protein